MERAVGEIFDFNGGGKLRVQDAGYKASCVPEKGRAIVYVTTNNKIGMLVHANVESWDWYVEKYSIVGWCYSADLLPKHE